MEGAQARAPAEERALLRAFRLESRAKTLASGRITSIIALVLIPLFVAQDLFVLHLPELLPWRILGLAPFLLFSILSLGTLQKHQILIVPLHAIALAGLISMICGITATVALREDVLHSEIHDTITGITVNVFAAFIFAAGARRFLPYIVLIPVASTLAAILAFGRLSPQDWSIFANPGVVILCVVWYSALQERLQYREFVARTRAEEGERRQKIQHNITSAMLNAINESAFLMKPDGTIVYANSTVAERLHIDTRELIGKSAFDLLPPDVSASRRLAINEAVDKGIPVRFTDERYGRIIDNSIHPVRGADDEVIYLAVLGIDITETMEARRKVEALLREKSVLLREVHHRIKNNMSIIASLLSLEADASPEPKIASSLKDAIGRVHAMMRIYDNLYKSENYSVFALRSYLEGLIAEIAAAYLASDCVRIESRIEDAEIPQNLAFSIGIIVNELVTNALKYAFPGGACGIVTIEVGCANPGSVRILVSDDGVGMPADQGLIRRGFGLQLVDLLVGQYEGTISMRGDAGTAYAIELRILEGETSSSE